MNYDLKDITKMKESFNLPIANFLYPLPIANRMLTLFELTKLNILTDALLSHNGQTRSLWKTKSTLFYLHRS